jgi:hypothetical protein
MPVSSGPLGVLLRAGHALAEAEGDAASMSGDLVQMGDVLREAGRLDEASTKYAPWNW